LFYATEGEASIDKPNRVGIVERHTHVYRIAKDGISLEDRTAKEISAQQEEGVR
jgi:ribosomal protein S19E (S16A)